MRFVPFAESNTICVTRPTIRSPRSRDSCTSSTSFGSASLDMLACKLVNFVSRSCESQRPLQLERLSPARTMTTHNFGLPTHRPVHCHLHVEFVVPFEMTHCGEPTGTDDYKSSWVIAVTRSAGSRTCDIEINSFGYRFPCTRSIRKSMSSSEERLRR